jgi:hypothetical protein
MTTPLRNRDSAELSTAHIAEARQPETVAEGQPKPVQGVRVEDAPTSYTKRMETLDAPPLFPDNELQDLRSKWDQVQTGFVDEPRNAVQEADGLVATAMKRLAEVFAQERSKLEQQWDRGDDVSTEDLRLALQRYRSFFHRLLSV